MRRAVPQTDDRQPPHGLVVVRCQKPMENRARGVDRCRRVAREQLERHERRPADGRAFVLEPAAEELELLAKSELADRAVCHGTLAVVRAPRVALDLVSPFRAQVGELALGPLLGELLRLRSCLLERQTELSERWVGPT